MSFALSRKFPSNLYVGTSASQLQQPWPTQRIYPKAIKRYQRTHRQMSRLLGKSLQKRHLLESLVSSKNVPYYGNVKLSMPALQNMWARRFWVLHNALPLALQLKPLKTNMLHGLERRAVLPLKMWCGQPGIKFLQKVATNSLNYAFSHKTPHVWNFMTALECYAPIILTRMNWTTQPNEGRFLMKHHKVKINGYSNLHAWYSLRPGDLIQQSTQSRALWDKKLLNSTSKDIKFFIK